jgi:anthranilate synthase/aminodeoxychorismate synthase-like glutamine amidotransferase
MILVVDNYDSFTYNLVQYLGELGAELKVLRNDVATPERVHQEAPSAIVVSPGPCTPNEAGESCHVIEEFYKELPILGVCLGHQCIGQTMGGKVIRAPKLMHGKTSRIEHEDKGIFKGLLNPFVATRYHSLIVESESLPDCLEVTARSSQGLIMGVMHREYPLHGVQFHPESILTREGKKLLKNFLALSGL